MSFEYKTDLDKVLKKSQQTLEKRAAQYTRRLGEQFKQAVSTFDEAYLVPVYTDSTVSLSLSGTDVDKQLEEDTILSQLIGEQEQAINDELKVMTERMLKEALKR